jgi:hypothetical protein
MQITQGYLEEVHPSTLGRVVIVIKKIILQTDAE